MNSGSQFINDKEDKADFSAGINFDEAFRLPAGGSTCDLYRTRWQRRTVFVKRLKEELRAKPVYLDALDKEFEVGVSLKHPSLPVYLSFNRDYIVMDYIDGQTLAEMIRRKDPWLTSEHNIVKMLRELIDVVAYLHRHNITHCDIKPDNILITSNGRNLVLIDFDKCYTDSLDDTSGHPGRYGLPVGVPGRMEMDFRGVAAVVKKMSREIRGFKFRGYKRFVKACQSPEVDAERLLEILNHIAGRHSRSLVIWSTLALIALAAGLAVWLSYPSRQTEDAHQEKSEVTAEKIIEAENKQTLSAPVEEFDEKSAVNGNMITQEQLHLDAREKAEILDKRIQPYFSELLAGLDRLNALKNDSTLTSEQLLDSIRLFGDLEDEYLEETAAILNETFPGTTDREFYRILSYSKAYTGYKRRATPELEAYGHEIERRRSANDLH